MGLPSLLLRKLYRRGSLRQVAPGRFAFVLQNPLGNATVTAPPHIVVNGIHHPPSSVHANGLDLAAISPERPYVFRKGEEVDLHMEGHLLRGGNRIHFEVETQEWGRLDVLFEDTDSDFCELPRDEEE